MTRNEIRWLTCLIPTLISPGLAAQTLGLPASYRPVMNGFGVALDVGGDTSFSTIGATGTVALGHVTIEGTRTALFNLSGTIASLTGENGQPGGSAIGAQLSLLGSFAVGVDRSRWGGVTRVHVPLAAALPLVGCASAKRIFELYVVPVWSFERLEQPAGPSWQSSWGSLSVGALLELQSGLGFQVGVGGLSQHATSDPYRRVVVSAGIHFSPHSILKAAPHASESQGGCSFVLAP
jgi:hypothetical protein